MPKAIILSLIIFSNFLFSIPGISQSRTITIFSQSNDAPFLSGYIEEVLSNLKSNGVDSIPIFNKVVNINRKIENRSFNRDRRDLIEYYNSRINFELSSDAKKAREKESSELINSDLFLFIKINNFNPLIEYQFNLHRVVNDSFYIKDYLVPFPEVNNDPIKIVNTFINPAKQYQIDLKNALLKLFPFINQPPIPKITIKNKPPTSDGKYYFKMGDTLLIHGKKTTDIDSPKENFSFSWKQIDEVDDLNISFEKDLNLKPNGIEQTIILNKRGKFNILLSVSDGITKSDNDTIQVIVTNPLNISIDNRLIVRNYKKNSLFKKKPRKNQKQLVYVSGDFTLSSSIDREFLPDTSKDKIILTSTSARFDTLDIKAQELRIMADIMAKENGKLFKKKKKIPTYYSTLEISKIISLNKKSYAVDYNGLILLNAGNYEVHLENNGVKSNTVELINEYVFAYSKPKFGLYEISGGFAPFIINGYELDSLGFSRKTTFSFSGFLEGHIYLWEKVKLGGQVGYGTSLIAGILSYQFNRKGLEIGGLFGLPAGERAYSAGLRIRMYKKILNLFRVSPMISPKSNNFYLGLTSTMIRMKKDVRETYGLGNEYSIGIEIGLYINK